MMAGIDMLHVPYRGGAPMITNLLAGQVHTGIDVMTTALPHIQSGALVALGMAGKRRFPGLPEVPTIAETVAGYEANSWCGLGAPKGTPDDIIERLNREINAGLADPAVKARLASVSTTPIVYTPAEFGAYVAAEVDKWGKVIRTAGVKPE
jgi:tripartite-type tricarboxylate transporter receptor subunit TctC